MPADIKAVNATASLFIKSLLLGIDHSLQKKQKSAKFDDSIDIEDIEELPFEEALEYMQKRLPMSAEEYYKLSDKARFRAFTVARLNDGDSLKKAKSLLEKSIAEGGTLTEFLKKTDTELLGELGLAGKGGGWYWENVYRTNVQTAYNTGRAIGFENVKPLALELVGIGDSRQTELCRSLTQPPVRRPYGDEFWERYWPPLHFSCRTTVRAIYDPAELEEEPITNIPDGIEKHRAKGFGTYPIDSDTWWDELPSMKRRAVAYGVQGEIEKVKGKLGIQSGGSSGGILDKSYEEQEEHAKKYYEAIRNRKSQSDIKQIAKNTGFSETQIKEIREHVFIEEHDFFDGRHERFGEDIQIALAWQRLENGNFTDLDILLLNHELEELTIMRTKGYYYEKAHEFANKKYNWQEEIKR
ncbi:MAG: hypothetical protein J6K22_08175 [Spirochaetaceae bacterium]|nr:hypothetical protein [Spirochaetaceae bacterium]